jgi:hypothetical protein
MPIRPPGRQTRSSSPTMPSWPGIEMASPADSTHLEGAVGEGEILGLAFQEGHLQPFRLGA